MSATERQPTNINMLSPLKFEFMVDKLPTVNFFCQSVSMPNVALGVTNVPSPFIKLPVPGDHLEYSELLITFIIDEDMANYIEMYNWVLGLGFPESFDQFKQLSDQDKRLDPSNNNNIMSDGYLFIANSAAKSNIEVKFINMFPTTLSDIAFDVRNNDVEYMECTVSFAFERYDIKRVV